MRSPDGRSIVNPSVTRRDLRASRVPETALSASAETRSAPPLQGGRAGSELADQEFLASIAPRRDSRAARLWHAAAPTGYSNGE
jgi:hypothetical protein